jgi:hypothetical protein
MNSKIVLLNGPAGCGKNTVTAATTEHLHTVDRRCKDKLFKLVQELFCVSEERFWEIYNNREIKETPLPDFMLSGIELAQLQSITGIPVNKMYTLYNNKISISIREAMIYVSEIVCKPAFGEDYFGVARANTIQDNEWAIDDSCGFDDEIKPTIDKLGQENVLLIRIKGRGNFNNDSRKFISDGVVDYTVDIYNSSTEEAYMTSMLELITNFYTGV